MEKEKGPADPPAGRSDGGRVGGETGRGDGIRSIVQKFSEPKVQYLVLVPLLGLMSGAFAFGLGTCFGPVLVPILLLAVPYYLGIKETLRLLKIGLLSLLVGSLVMAVILGQVLYDRNPDLLPATVNSQDGFITEATVEPLKGSPGETYMFTAKVDGSVLHPDEDATIYILVRDYLQERWSLGLSSRVVFNDTPSRVGNTTYVMNHTLDEDTLYFVTFLAEITNRTSGESRWLSATYGVIVVTLTSSGQAIAGMLPLTLFSMVLFPYGTVFLILVSVLWWTRKSRERRLTMERELEEVEREARLEREDREDGEFACTSCGASVGRDDAACPKCGARFETREEGDAPGGDGSGKGNDPVEQGGGPSGGT